MHVTQGCVGGSNGLLFITRLSRSGEFIRLIDNEDVRDRKATIFVKMFIILKNNPPQKPSFFFVHENFS